MTKRTEHNKSDAPLGWSGGKWFMVHDYPLLDSRAFSVLKSFTAGGTAGAISKTSVAPMERIKLLLQIETLRSHEKHAPRRTVREIFRDVFRFEGLKAFWRGNGTNIIRIIPNKGILFMCNDVYVSLMSDENGHLSMSKRFIAGSLSGATLVSFTYPLDFIQGRIASGTKYKGIIDCFSRTVKAEGFLALYRGYLASLLGIMPYTGSQFFIYEVLKRQMTEENQDLTIYQKLFAGAVAGGLAQSVSFPMDTVRRRLQVQGGAVGAVEYNSTWDCCVKIWRNEGLIGFYRGVWLNALRAAPSQAIQFAVYGGMKSILKV